MDFANIGVIPESKHDKYLTGIFHPSSMRSIGDFFQHSKRWNHLKELQKHYGTSQDQFGGGFAPKISIL